MSSENNNEVRDPTAAFIEHLERTGFFEQITHLETSLKSIVGEMEAFGESTNQRQGESENIAAHILAMEAVITTVMKKYPIEESDLLTEIQRQAAALTADAVANPTVEAIAINMLRKSRIDE